MTEEDDNHRFWNIPVEAVLDEIVNKAVERGPFKTKAEFIRTAARNQAAAVHMKRGIKK